MDESDEIFTDIPPTFAVQIFVQDLVHVRRDLAVDPMLSEPWSCDPDRCRPRLGKNLCCKVETRCPQLKGERCAVQETKPFSCALFPLDLVRLGGLRVVTTVKNLDFFQTGWSRYDRDMLRCFEGPERERDPLFSVQKTILLRVFTRSEVALMERGLGLGSGAAQARKQIRTPAGSR